jgi:lipopolysaccharide export LptBFGC system permease protein LptF
MKEYVERQELPANGGLLLDGHDKTEKVNSHVSRRVQKLKVGLSAMKARFIKTDEKGSIWELEDVHFRDFRVDDAVGTGYLQKIENHRLPEGLADLEETTVKDPREYSFSELLEKIRYIEERGLANTDPLKVELYLKTSFPFCVLIFALIGSTMGLASHRSGGFVGFGISLVVTFLYYISMSISSSLGKTGVIDPFLSAWLHNIVFFIFAIVNVFRVQQK